MRRFWFAIFCVGVAIAATIVPLHDRSLDMIIFAALTILAVLFIRLRMGAAIPGWAPVLMLILTGIGHALAFLWIDYEYPHSLDLPHLRTFAIAYLVVGFYLWITSRLRYQRRA